MFSKIIDRITRGSEDADKIKARETWEGALSLPSIAELPKRKQAAVLRSLMEEPRLDTLIPGVPGFRVASCHRFNEMVNFAGITDDGTFLVGGAEELHREDKEDIQDRSIDASLARDISAALLESRATTKNQIGRFRGIEFDDWTRDEGLVQHDASETIADAALAKAGFKNPRMHNGQLHPYAYARLAEQCASLRDTFDRHLEEMPRQRPAEMTAQGDAAAPVRLSSAGTQERIMEAAQRRHHADQAATAQSKGRRSDPRDNSEER